MCRHHPVADARRGEPVRTVVPYDTLCVARVVEGDVGKDTLRAGLVEASCDIAQDMRVRVVVVRIEHHHHIATCMANALVHRVVKALVLFADESGAGSVFAHDIGGGIAR